jgi:antitoxin (DNA-binding transcriptional repressor) of toxin-antitoxin stability system
MRESTEVGPTVSKSTLKAKALELCQEVESTAGERSITKHGEPVLKAIPCSRDPEEALKAFRGSVLRYDDPLEPVGVGSEEQA